MLVARLLLAEAGVVFLVVVAPAWDELRARRPGGHGRLYWQTKQARAGRQAGLFPLVPSNGLVHGSTVTIALPAAVATRTTPSSQELRATT